MQQICLAEDAIVFADMENIPEQKHFLSFSSNSDKVHQYLEIGKRISEGKKREDRFIDAINENTPFILLNSKDEDDIMGVDAYMTGYKGQKTPFHLPLKVQVKQRLKGGDDLGLEIIKGWPPSSKDIRDINFNGKDMKSSVNYYFHIDRTGKVRIFNGKMVRELSEKMGISAINAWSHGIFSGRRYDIEPYGQIVVVAEKGIGGRKTKNGLKVISYINVSSILPTYQFSI